MRCGLLPGTYRAVLLRNARLREAVLHKQDLGAVAGLAVFNSVRGWLAARLRSQAVPPLCAVHDR